MQTDIRIARGATRMAAMIWRSRWSALTCRVLAAAIRAAFLAASSRARGDTPEVFGRAERGLAAHRRDRVDGCRRVRWRCSQRSRGSMRSFPGTPVTDAAPSRTAGQESLLSHSNPSATRPRPRGLSSCVTPTVHVESVRRVYIRGGTTGVQPARSHDSCGWSTSQRGHQFPSPNWYAPCTMAEFRQNTG